MGSSLAGTVALVAGATRGAGRGIALQLGAAGATVYATGRTTRTQRSEMDRPETIEETAELVTQAGGEGVAVPVDHLDPEQVRALVERVEREQGRLDVLVNDVWGGDPLAEWNTPVWEHSLEKGLRLLRLAVDTVGLRLFGTSSRLHARDAFYAATAVNRGIPAIVSADAAFDDVPQLERVDPLVATERL